jgi:hypothetical protein
METGAAGTFFVVDQEDGTRRGADPTGRAA